MLSDPKALNKATAKSFATVLGKSSEAECADSVRVKGASTPTYLPKDLFKSLDKPIRKELQLSDVSSDSSSESESEPPEASGDESQQNGSLDNQPASSEVPSPGDVGDTLQQSQLNNQPPHGLRPPLVGSQLKTGYKANSFSEAYSSEAWVYYAGLMNDHMAKMESFIRAKAQNCEKTCLIKMAPGFTPTGSPEIFQMSISGSISLRRFWDNNKKTYTNLQPGRDFIVTPTAVPGVAEIWVPNESHRLWLFHQNRFSYHKLIIEKNGKVENLGVKGSFFITSLRAPAQLYDILGAEYEHSDKYNKPVAEMFRKLCPEAVDLHVEEVTKQVPCLDPTSLEWVVKDVPGHKRVSITCPPETTFKLPDGPMVLNLGEEIGTRIVHTRRVLATTECQLCGERCWNGCRNRCSQCGLSGHIKDDCPNKQLGDIRRSSQWVETSVKTALRIFSNPLYDDGEDHQQVMERRVGDVAIQEQVAEAQAKIMILANLPKEARDDVEESQFDKTDLLSVSQDSATLRSKAKSSASESRRRSKANRKKKESAAIAEMKKQQEEAARLVREQTQSTDSQILRAPTQEDAAAEALLRKQLAELAALPEEERVAEVHQLAEGGPVDTAAATSNTDQSPEMATSHHPEPETKMKDLWSDQIESEEMTSQTIELKVDEEESLQKPVKRPHDSDSEHENPTTKKINSKEELSDVDQLNMIVDKVAENLLKDD